MSIDRWVDKPCSERSPTHMNTSKKSCGKEASVTPFILNSNFTASSIIFLFLCCTFIFINQIHLWIIHFCEMAWGSVTDRQGVSIGTLFAVFKWIESRDTVMKLWQIWKEWCTCSPTMMGTGYYIKICEPKSYLWNMLFTVNTLW